MTTPTDTPTPDAPVCPDCGMKYKIIYEERHEKDCISTPAPDPVAEGETLKARAATDAYDAEAWKEPLTASAIASIQAQNWTDTPLTSDEKNLIWMTARCVEARLRSDLASLKGGREVTDAMVERANAAFLQYIDPADKSKGLRTDMRAALRAALQENV